MSAASEGPSGADRYARLAAKYEAMVQLRRGESDDPRRAMRELARLFPGALRELDELPFGELECRRVHACALAEGRTTEPEPWLTALDRYHELLAGALWARQWLAGRRTVDASTLEDFARDAADGARVWHASLALVAKPPSGRMTDVVLAKLACELGVSLVELRARVYVPLRPRSG